MQLLERYQGCLLGLAVGDAVGTTLEFSPRGTFEPITDMVGGGPFNLEPGQWTDDTSMTLCLAESLVRCEGFDEHDQMERYLRWYREGYLSSTGSCFDIGGTTRLALERFERTGDPFSGPTDKTSAGNGSIMRLAPVSMYFARDPGKGIGLAADSSRTTHGATAAVDACRYMAGMIMGALAGAGKEEILSGGYCPVPGYWDLHPLCPEIDEVARGSYKCKELSAIKGSGYVVRSLEAALWAFSTTPDFRAGCLAAANLGDDADTTAAVYGQIAGAYYGVRGIPEEWLEVLSNVEMIRDLCKQLYSQAYSD